MATTYKGVHDVLTQGYFDDGVVQVPQWLTLTNLIVKLQEKLSTYTSANVGNKFYSILFYD